MPDLFSTRQLLDAILALMALEGVALLGWRRCRGSGIGAGDLLANLAAGAALLVACRLAVGGASALAMAVALAAALAGHLVDLSRRWRCAAPATTTTTARDERHRPIEPAADASLSEPL